MPAAANRARAVPGGEPPAVAVIIPTYNRRTLVERAVRSVLAQTFADFELLVVDDGSEDGTGERLAGLDGRLRYQWQPNRGVAAARNAGLRCARAPVVAFLDSDNRWLPDHLAVIFDVLARHPAAVLASTCPEFRLDGRERPENAQLIDGLPRAVLGNFVGYVSCVAVRRDALLDVGGFDERLAVGEDDDLWLRLALRGPFVTVRGCTIVRQPTRAGLRDRGRRSGAYTEANAHSVRGAIAELERRPAAESRAVLERARATLLVLGAVKALEDRDHPAAQAALAEACALLPSLQRNPGLILAHLWKSVSGVGELVRRAEAASAAMPDLESHAALYFRGYAAMLALRRARPWKAVQLVIRRPHLLRRDFISRAYGPALQSAGDWLRELIHSRRDPSAGRHPAPIERTPGAGVTGERR